MPPKSTTNASRGTAVSNAAKSIQAKAKRAKKNAAAAKKKTSAKVQKVRRLFARFNPNTPGGYGPNSQATEAAKNMRLPRNTGKGKNFTATKLGNGRRWASGSRLLLWLLLVNH